MQKKMIVVLGLALVLTGCGWQEQVKEKYDDCVKHCTEVLEQNSQCFIACARTGETPSQCTTDCRSKITPCSAMCCERARDYATQEKNAEKGSWAACYR